MTSPLLDVCSLKTYFFTPRGLIKAIGGIDFSIGSGRTLALVGESGCGKSMTALSILRLVPEPGKIVEGTISFAGEDLLRLPPTEMRRIRGNQIAMIFQEPMTSLNPVFTVKRQIGEVLELHRGLHGQEQEEEAAALLQQVGIPDARKRLASYPHQLSGGMRQRVVIAMALAGHPQLLIADEPTTALDVTIQAQILALLDELRRSRGMSMLLISHDLGVVAETADAVAIMYAGLIMEAADVAPLFNEPLHPYTRGLLACIPRLGEERQRLVPIPDQVTDAMQHGDGCPFAPRCREVMHQCREHLPPLREVAPNHQVRCWKAL
ncbi:MAG: ABC transporter ATP-binding protein [Deltaproteobacteria bacterium HGW-Deltaproteobacteria-4]|nr:MAG: ABC transporter ATP-binding protein [Deltaproteobacteria bacterium HGW-Deltaproteobacteria-4]